MPSFKLLVLGGVHAGRHIPLSPPFLIGRSADCNIRASSETISYEHCQIDEADGYLVVRDLDSMTGTFINDDRLLRDYLLCDGDELRVGPLRFLVQIDSPIALPESTEDIGMETLRGQPE